MSAPIARAIRQAFASYRNNIEIARDPDEAARSRDTAWSRAAKARARLERNIDRLETATLATSESAR